MADSLTLRLLDPESDGELYRTAYDWRTPKRHIQPGRMPFEVFASTDPTHIAVGLFNGDLMAVYFLHEIEPTVFQAHFTSRRKSNWNDLVLGAKAVIEAFLTNGASEIVAWILPRNRPLCQFVEALGFVAQGVTHFSCNPADNTFTLALPTEANAFVKYAIKGTVP